MGCAGSTPTSDDTSKKLKKPKPWKHTQAITPAQLKQMREEFWDTTPHYGGQKEIWDALRAAAEAELSLAQTIVDTAGIIVSNADMTLCYDERDAKFKQAVLRRIWLDRQTTGTDVQCPVEELGRKPVDVGEKVIKSGQHFKVPNTNY